jgi:hypothetical protein
MMDPLASRTLRKFLSQQEPSEEHLSVAPPGWEGPVKEMKKDKDIDNPWALAWHMKNKGDKPHKKDADETTSAAGEKAKAEWFRQFQEIAVSEYGAHPGKLNWADAGFYQHKGVSPEEAAKKMYKRADSWDSLVRRVAARAILGDSEELLSTVFPSDEALKKYLHEHPKADPSKHTVKKPGEGGGARVPKPSPLDNKDLPEDFDKDPVFNKAKSKDATTEDLKKAMDLIDETADHMAETSHWDGSPTEKAMQEAKGHISDKFHKAVQESPEYKTKLMPPDSGYYPQKKPKGYKDAEGAAKIKAQLSESDRAAAESMPDEDLDKDEAYSHPKIKALSKSLVDKVKKGELSRGDLGKRMGEIENLRDAMSRGGRQAKTEEEHDGWRFPARQLYKLWQGYNDAIQTVGRLEK